MTRFRSVSFSSLAVLALVGAGAAQEAAPTDPLTAEAILDRCIEASGGRAAWESLTSIRGLGTIEVVGANVRGSVAIYQTADGFRRSVDAGGAGVQVTVRRGDEAWVSNARGQVKAMEGPELLKMQRDKSFNPLLDPSRIYASLSVTGVEEVAGSQAWVIRCVPVNDPEAEDLRYFDLESGLQVKVVQRGSGQGAAVPTEVFLSDYRPVGDVQFAFTTMIVAGRGQVQVALETMQANVSIPPCLFEKPDGEVVKPFMAQPRQVLEAFMKEDVNALSPAEARSWMKRLIDARARIPEDFPQTEALEAVFQECIRACMERLGRIEPQDGDGRSEHPSGSDHPS